MTKILVTGATGFIGSYFCDSLLQNNVGEVHITKRYRSPFGGLKDLSTDNNLKLHECDLRDSLAVYKMLDETNPDYIFHFAAQSSVASSWGYPVTTLLDNVKMQANLMEALRLLDQSPKFLVASTSEAYNATRQEDWPIKEEDSLRPLNPYAVSKITQEMMAHQYNASQKLPVFIARSFNIEGPRRPEAFVVSSFARQIAQIEKYSLEPSVKVGNLRARRDFVDVRDAVKAYWLIAESGEPTASYNVASGESYSIQEVLDTLISLSRTKITVTQDPNRMRPSDVPERTGDNSKLRSLGWKPEITLEKTLKDTLDYWREHA